MSGDGPSALEAVLRPRAVAIVGASADPRKRGFQAVRALVASGYGGAVYPVNPRGGELLGLAVHPSLEALPGPADLALVCTPAASAPEVVEACGRAGVPAAVLLAVGFRESSDEGGRLEEAVAEAARRHGVRLVGPNTSGLMNMAVGLNLIGARGVRPGGLGLLVQSGNLALNLMLDAGRRSDAGLSICVGVGNELDLGFAEFLDALRDDEGTSAILVHAEGFRRGHAALDAAARAARVKPVVVLKAARTPEAGAAARSHTGAVAGSHLVLRAALRQAGVVQVSRSDELFHVGETLASQPPVPPGAGIAILSDGGGQGTLAVDLLTESATPPAALAEETRVALRGLLGPAASVANPVDLAGAADADPERFARALELLVADPAVGAVLVVGLFGGYGVRFDEALVEAEVRAAEGMAAAAGDAGKGLVVHTMYAPEATLPLRRLRAARVPVVESLEVACRAATALVERGRALAAPPWRPLRPEEEGSGAGATDGRSADPGGAARAGAPDGRAADPGAASAETPGAPSALAESEARSLFERAGVPLVPALACADADAAVRAAASVDGPVVLKVLARGLAHKSDAGGVALDVRGEDAVRAAFARVTASAARHGGNDGRAPDVQGVLVSPHLPPPLAELLVGVRRDPTVGPVLTVGAGGIWVEALADVAVRALPVDRAEVLAMLGELRIAPLLRGGRGRPPVALEPVAAAALALAGLIAGTDVVEAEVNPLFAYADRAVAVDARVYVRGDPGGGPSHS